MGCSFSTGDGASFVAMLTLLKQCIESHGYIIGDHEYKAIWKAIGGGRCGGGSGDFVACHSWDVYVNMVPLDVIYFAQPGPGDPHCDGPADCISCYLELATVSPISYTGCLYTNPYDIDSAAGIYTISQVQVGQVLIPQIKDFFAFPIGSDWSPPEPPPPDPYNWPDEYNDIECQIGAWLNAIFNIEIEGVLRDITEIICCLPRPAFLILNSYKENLYQVQGVDFVQSFFSITLYFPIIPGSEINNDGDPVDTCYTHNWTVDDLTFSYIPNTNFQMLKHYVENFNTLNEIRLKIMLNGYGINVNTQNTKTQGMQANIELDVSVPKASIETSITVNSNSYEIT